MTPHEVAVVTGASSGIGEAVAGGLLARGLTVVTLQRSAPRIKHPNLHFRPIDLSDLEATKSLAREVAVEFPVRYLVNNAGANRPALLEDATIDDFHYVSAITLGAAMVLMQAFVPGMRAARFGRIVSISSRAIMGKTYRTVYASAKAGLLGMARTVAIEVGGDGITVNVVVPGPVASDLFNIGHPVGSAKRQTVIDSVLVKRVGRGAGRSSRRKARGQRSRHRRCRWRRAGPRRARWTALEWMRCARRSSTQCAARSASGST